MTTTLTTSVRIQRRVFTTTGTDFQLLGYDPRNRWLDADWLSGPEMGMWYGMNRLMVGQVVFQNAVRV
ncbi:MAG: hypothetical protein H8F28_23105 [Fibrella sp.]|nr:hypothetical protein [Armatimonadota bacterium]